MFTPVATVFASPVSFCRNVILPPPTLYVPLPAGTSHSPSSLWLASEAGSSWVAGLNFSSCVRSPVPEPAHQTRILAFASAPNP